MGDEAAYFDDSMSRTGVAANHGNYVVEVDANFFPTPPSKDAIVVLVKKVIGQLP